MRAYLLAGLLVLAFLITAYPAVAADNVAVGTEIALPAPRLKGPVSVEETLARRRSVRQFAPRELTMAEISQLAWSAQGITDEKTGHRTVPSAMARYPLELYLVTPQWAAHYVPQGHKLVVVAVGDKRAELSGQAAVKNAPLTMVIAGEYERLRISNKAAAERFTIIEAGHAAQSIHLQAVALGLVSVPVGGYEDAAVIKALALPAGVTPLLLVPVGAPVAG